MFTYMGEYKNIPNPWENNVYVSPFVCGDFISFQYNVDIEPPNAVRDLGVCVYGGGILGEDNKVDFDNLSNMFRHIVPSNMNVNYAFFSKKYVSNSIGKRIKDNVFYTKFYRQKVYVNTFDSLGLFLRNINFRVGQDLVFKKNYVVNDDGFGTPTVCVVILDVESVMELDASNKDFVDSFVFCLEQMREAKFFPVFVCDKYYRQVQDFFDTANVSIPQVAFFEEKDNLLYHNPSFISPKVKSLDGNFAVSIIKGYNIIIPTTVSQFPLKRVDSKTRGETVIKLTSAYSRGITPVSMIWTEQNRNIKGFWDVLVENTKTNGYEESERIRYE